MFGNLIAATRPHDIDTSSRSPRVRHKRDGIDKPQSMMVGIRPQREKGERVRINVSGQVFETYKSTLLSKEGSIFRLKGISKMFDSIRNEYYFERDSKAFEGILVYMQCGICMKPDKVSYKVFIEELQYFGFGTIALKIYNEKCTGYQRKRYNVKDTKTIKGYIWHLLEFPRMNAISKGLTLFSSIIILLSTCLICIESIPAVKKSKTYEFIYIVELACVGWFTLETCLRFLTCNNKRYFFTNPINILDLISIAPVYILKSLDRNHVFLSSVLRFLRVTRLIPAFGSEGFVRIFNTIIITLQTSAKEFACFLSLLAFMIVLFSCLLYSIENNASNFNEDFSSVPKNAWYCVVTITSVGYGDSVPTSIGGKLITSVMFGATILILSLPIPIIISNFLRAHDMLMKDGSLENFYFEHEKSKEVEQLLLKEVAVGDLVQQVKAIETNGNLSLSSDEEEEEEANEKDKCLYDDEEECLKKEGEDE